MTCGILQQDVWNSAILWNSATNSVNKELQKNAEFRR